MRYRKLTLEDTARRILEGTFYRIAIKEHSDDWNKYRDPQMFAAIPPLTGDPVADAWIGGAGEYEAFLCAEPAPEWTRDPARFLSRPVLPTLKTERDHALIETPFAWRRRNLFIGVPLIAQPGYSGAEAGVRA